MNFKAMRALRQKPSPIDGNLLAKLRSAGHGQWSWSVFREAPRLPNGWQLLKDGVAEDWGTATEAARQFIESVDPKAL